MLFSILIIWEDCTQNYCHDLLFLLSELRSVHSCVWRHSSLCTQVFSQEIPPCLIRCSGPGTWSAWAKKNLVVGAFAVSLDGEVTQVSAAYFIDQRTVCVYVLYVFAEPFPTPPGLWALDVPIEHYYSMTIWFKEKKNTSHSKIHKIKLP